MGIYITILEQGLIYGILALGVYITYKILDFPDLTVDGSFPLGAALTATMITRGVHPILTLPASFLIGCACRSLHRSDSCKIQGKRSLIRNYHDDSTVDDQLKTGRNSKCPNLWR